MDQHASFGSFNSSDKFLQFFKEIQNCRTPNETLLYYSKHILDKFKPWGVGFFLVDDSFDFVPQIVFPLEEELIFREWLEVLVDKGFFSNVLMSHQPGFFHLDFVQAKSRGLKNGILLPLECGVDLVGVLGIFFQEEDLFKKEDVQFWYQATSPFVSSQYLAQKYRVENTAQREKIQEFFKLNQQTKSIISDALFLLNSSFQVEDCNSSALKITGLSPKDILFLDFRHLFDDDNKKILSNILKRLQNGEEIRHAEISLKSGLGEIVPVSVGGGTIRGSCAATTQFLISLKDLTEIRALLSGIEKVRTEIEGFEETDHGRESQLLDLQKKMGEIQYLFEFNLNVLQNISSGVIGIDDQGNINLFNQSASRITGLLEGDVLGNSLEYVECLRGFIPIFENVLKSKKEQKGLESEIVNGDGENALLSVTASPIFHGNSELKGCVFVFADITLIREMHQKVLDQERMAALGKMITGVAHEIRNPLNVMRGLAEIMDKGIVNPEKVPKYLRTIIGQIDRMEMLLRDMMDSVKQGEPCLKMQKIEPVVSEIIETYKMGFQSSSRERIQIIFNPPKEPLPDLNIDENQVQQILFNLIKNSWDSIPEKGHIICSLFDEEKFVLLKVEDNGLGIDQDTQDRIFDAFFTTKLAKGTGLGLSIVKSIMERHGGRVKVKSEVGKGSIFLLYFPKLKPLMEGIDE